MVVKALALMVLILGIFWGLHGHWLLWQVDADGIAPITPGKTPYWDFTNLWAGGRLALSGQVDVLFDPESYRAALREMLSPALADQEWSYPPSILLIGVPLSLLPLSIAYLVWTLGSVGALYLACRSLGLGRGYSVAACLSPLVFFNALFGQNGTLSAALLIAGLANVDRRPILGGILIGLVSLKPHFGILIPFCLIAGGYRVSFAAAFATCLFLVTATGLLFGMDVWLGFWNVTRPLMTAILEAPFPQGYQANASTVFALTRSFGADVATAYAVQGTAVIAALIGVVWLWRQPRSQSPELRVAITVSLALVATPYGYLYDAVGLSVCALLLLTHAWPRSIFMPLAAAVLWFTPLLARIANQSGHRIGVVFIILGAGLLLSEYRARNRVTETAVHRTA